MKMLGEHCRQGWREACLLTGRYRLFGCDEAFIHIVVSVVRFDGRPIRHLVDKPPRQGPRRQCA